MPAATPPQTGKAVVYGINAMTIGGFATILPQSTGLGHKFNLKDTKDGDGNDANLTATNEHTEMDIEFVPYGATVTAAKAVCVFLGPLSSVAIATHPVAAYNGTWIYVGDAGMKITNEEKLSYTLRCRKYADATQNTSLSTAVQA